MRVGEAQRRDGKAWAEVCVALMRSDGRLGDNQPATVRLRPGRPGSGSPFERASEQDEKKGAETEMKAEVRRLTPKECERLMGFPDGYTGCMGGDAARYAACGNSWASNCARRVLKGMHRADAKAEGERRAFRYGTISSGVECHSLAAGGLGDRAVFFSEISPAPVALLKDRYPETPVLGDMTLVDYDEERKCVHNRPYDGYSAPDASALGFRPYATDGAVEIPCEKGGIDLVSGGTPCQSVSCAGKRHGMSEGSGTRSSLAFQLPRIGKAVGARWLLWENVPGAFSSNGGRDFAWFAHKMAAAGYSLAWRTLDAQYVRTDRHPRAVPQRRRRIWMAAYRGGDWRVPCEALFEPMRALGDEPPKRTVGAGFTAELGRAGGGSAEGEAAGHDGNGGGALDDFKAFLGAADAEMVALLVKRGICASPERRMAELAKKDVDGGGAGAVATGGLFGESLFGGGAAKRRQGEGLREADLDLRMPMTGKIREMRLCDLCEWARTVSKKVGFCGEMFRGVGGRDGEATPDDIDGRMLDNIGNAGVLSDGICVTMMMPEWNAGVTAEELAGMPPAAAELYDGDVCGLSDVLEDAPDAKYLLSWRGASGILRRAAKRGKELPLELGYALLERVVDQAGRVKWVAENGKATTKNEGDLSERQVAKSMFDDFVSPFRGWDEVVAVAPGADDGAAEKAAEAEDAEADGCGGGGDDEGEDGDGE